MKRLAIFAALTLAGCQTAQPGIDIREVRVPVPVACVDPADIPADPPRAVLSGSAAVDVVTLAALVTELRKASGEMRALLSGCSK